MFTFHIGECRFKFHLWLLTPAGSNTEPVWQQLRTPVIDSLPPAVESWIEFLPPGSSPCPTPAIVSPWGVNEWIVELCFSLSLSYCHLAFQINFKVKESAFLFCFVFNWEEPRMKWCLTKPGRAFSNSHPEHTSLLIIALCNCGLCDNEGRAHGKQWKGSLLWSNIWLTQLIALWGNVREECGRAWCQAQTEIAQGRIWFMCKREALSLGARNVLSIVQITHLLTQTWSVGISSTQLLTFSSISLSASHLTACS